MASCAPQHAKVNDFRLEEKFCDLKIRVGDKYFSCHRVILASASEYFDALLGGSFKEKNASETFLHNIDEETFGEVLRCVYNSSEYKYESTTVSLYKLLDASLFLRIRPLEVKCVSYIVENTSSVENLVQIFALAQSMRVTELIDVVSEYLIKNFDIFYDDKALLELSFDDISFLLNRWLQAELYCKYESLMFHFIICWMCHAPEERTQYFMEVMEVVNFDALSSDYITFILQHMENSSADLPNSGKIHSSLLGKRKLNSALPSASRNNEDLNKLLLKRRISKYFVGCEKSLMDCNPVIPASFHNPTFYKDTLSLHIFVEYDYYYDLPETRIEEDIVLSSNKYHPKWFVSGKTNAWKNCKHRWTGFEASSNLLYCMEILENRNNPVSMPRQRFCTYQSAEMKEASKILSFPPITLESTEIVMCAIPQGNSIYLLDSQMSNENFMPIANGQFSIEDISRGFYNYNCEIDQWFSAPPMESKQFYPRLTANHNLIYSIGGWTERGHLRNTAQSFDYRAGKWMKLPDLSNNSYLKHPIQTICTVEEKVYISNGDCIDIFDIVAHKWERMNPLPFQNGVSSVQKILSYNNSLIVLVNDSYCAEYTGCDAFQIATYRHHSQHWHTCEYLRNAISQAALNTEGIFYMHYCIKDIITFKM